jgi:hypothetical protein
VTTTCSPTGGGHCSASSRRWACAPADFDRRAAPHHALRGGCGTRPSPLP